MINENNPLGFGRNLPQRNSKVYDGDMRTLVRVDVSGGIGGTGVVKDAYSNRSGEIIHLEPPVFYVKGVPTIRSGEAKIITNGSPYSIYSLGQTIEEYVKENMPDPKEKDSNN